MPFSKLDRFMIEVAGLIGFCQSSKDLNYYKVPQAWIDTMTKQADKLQKMQDEIIDLDYNSRKE